MCDVVINFLGEKQHCPPSDAITDNIVSNKLLSIGFDDSDESRSYLGVEIRALLSMVSNLHSTVAALISFHIAVLETAAGVKHRVFTGWCQECV